MEKIAFFGASVTQQKDGYWKYFAEKNNNFLIKNFGYGSRHLNDAGVSYLDDVIAFEPKYCFIDWFSTGYIKYNEDKFDEIIEYVNTIIYKLINNNITIVFLTFPDLTVDKEEVYLKLNSYLSSMYVPTLDISKSFNDLSIILRDGIHTTQKGSEEYGKLIYDYFINNIYDKELKHIKEIEKTKYCEIKTCEINQTIKDRLVLEGNGEVIGISQYIGPYSGLVRINDKIYNNWDRWCYYEREMVNLKFEVNGITIIEVLEDDFDRTSCEYSMDWSIKKQLKLNTIFYIGDDLKIIDKR